MNWHASRRTLRVCALLIVLAAVAALWRRESTERIIDAWMEVSNGGASKEEPDARLKRIVEIGPRAVPMLLNRVREEDSLRERAYRAAWNYFPAWVRQKLPDPKQVDHEEKISRRASQALSGFGEEIIPALVKAGCDPNWRVRQCVVPHLGKFAESSEIAFVQTVELLRDSSANVRIDAVIALGRFTNRTELVPALTARLLDDDKGSKPGQVFFVRANSASVLGGFGSNALAAVPELRKLMRQTVGDRANLYSAVQAAVAVWRIEGKADDVLPFMCQVIRTSPDSSCWLPILNAFTEMGPLAKHAAPAVEALQERYHGRRISSPWPIAESIEKTLRSITAAQENRDGP